MRERAGLTLADVKSRTGYGISTINGLEQRGEGSERLKEKLKEVLEAALAVTESVTLPVESVNPPLALHEVPPEYHTSEIGQLLAEIQRIKHDVAALERIALKIANEKGKS